MPPVPPEYFIKPAHQQILDCYIIKWLAYVIIGILLLPLGLWQVSIGMGLGIIFSAVSYYTGIRVTLAFEGQKELE